MSKLLSLSIQTNDYENIAALAEVFTFLEGEPLGHSTTHLPYVLQCFLDYMEWGVLEGEELLAIASTVSDLKIRVFDEMGRRKGVASVFEERDKYFIYDKSES